MLMVIIGFIIVLVGLEAFLLYKLTTIVNYLQQRQAILDMKLDTLSVFVTYGNDSDDDTSTTLQ